MEKRNTRKKLGTEPYKGVRDFYPADMAVQNYILGTMRKTAESFGYAEYDASILEPAELYRAKTGEEIINEQTYTFTDRGDRQVTLRPEMTPTVARMVAAKKRELSFPLRWYSIPNLFRYERPQRGRLREHWQLNIDLFGIDGMEADVEVISAAYAIMKNFGMKDEDFEILVSTVAVANALDGFFGKEKSKELARVADKKNKVTGQEFRSLISSIIGDESDAYIQALESATVKEFLENIPPELAQSNEMQEGCSAVKEVLKNTLSINVRFAPYIRRGFDYYTGTLFEVFDKNPENNRSIFGGGRYDDLLAIFGAERVPAVGFGMGDVMIREVLETYGLLKGRVPQTKTDVYICVLDDAFNSAANTLAADLREQGLNVAIDYTGKKVGDQIKKANKDGIRYALCIGEEEVASSKYKIKDLVTGAEKVATKDTIVTMVRV